jgi:hypothetical protein
VKIHGLLKPAKTHRPELFESEIPLHEPARRAANHHGTRLGDSLNASRNIGGFSYSKALLALAVANRANHDRTGMDSDPDLQRSANVAEARPQVTHRLDDPKSRSDCAKRAVLVCTGIPEIYQQAITQVLGDVAGEVADDVAAASLVFAQHFSQVLRI